MGGGLLNLIAYGNQNIILNDNPSKTFFKSVYSKYTNFGMQKLRVDYNGLKSLHLTEPQLFTFKIPRYSELLMNAFIAVDIPHIWSPIYSPTDCIGEWIPYEFKWIDNLGLQMIKEVTIECGSQIIQKYSGAYIQAMAERDFAKNKKHILDEMTANTPEFNDPANSGTRNNEYPNAFYTSSSVGAEPSIRGKTIYIPINSWFSFNSRMAFPMIALQYNELVINVTMRPINELFRIRDINDDENDYPYVKPNFNLGDFQFHRFLQTPPNVALDYSDIATEPSHGYNIHMLATYCFLSEEETRVFSSKDQHYLIKTIYEHEFYDITGSRKVSLDSLGLVSSWMLRYQRSDINHRNEWSNYTNWPYNYLPQDISEADEWGALDFSCCINECNFVDTVGPGRQPDGTMTNIKITGDFAVQNEKHILKSLGILFNGEYRENVLELGVYNSIEKYLTTKGNAPDCLYCYNFCLNTDPHSIQPTGAVNLSKFSKIELEFTTQEPPFNPDAEYLTICDPENGEVIGVNKPTTNLFEYNYNLTVFEERYNVVSFIGGNCGLMFAR
jgi:hypothetical protein